MAPGRSGPWDAGIILAGVRWLQRLGGMGRGGFGVVLGMGVGGGGDCGRHWAPGRTPIPVGARKDAAPDAVARLEGRHSWRPLSSVGSTRSSAAGRLGSFLRSSPTGPGPAKSCVKRSGGFPTPTPTGGLKVPPPGAPYFSQKSPHRRASGMIPRETGRGLSISGAHHVAAVERIVGATLVVALPRTAPPSAGHCLDTTEPGGWSGDFLVADWDRRPERCLERRRPRRRLGPASFRAPGMATWSDSAGERCDPAGHPQGVPLRSSGIGSCKEKEEDEGRSVLPFLIGLGEG